MCVRKLCRKILNLQILFWWSPQPFWVIPPHPIPLYPSSSLPQPCGSQCFKNVWEKCLLFCNDRAWPGCVWFYVASVCVCNSLLLFFPSFFFLSFFSLPSMDHWLQSSMIVLSSCPLFNGPFWRSVTKKTKYAFLTTGLMLPMPCYLNFYFIEIFKPCTFQHVLEPLEFACWFSWEFGLRAALALLTFSLFDFPFPAHPFPQMACWKSRNSLA